MSMPVKYTCPACTAILKTAEPLPVGKVIKCPRCMRQFPAPAVVGAPVTAPSGGSLAGKTANAPVAKAPAPVSKPVPAPAAARATKPTAAPAPARDTKLAATAKQTQLTANAAKPTQLAATSPPPPTTPPAAGPKLRFPCPKCTGVLKVSTPPPAGKMLKCPRCNAVFPVPGAKPPTMLNAPAAVAKAPAPASAKTAAPKTILAKPVSPGPTPVAKARPKTMLAKPAAASAPPIAPKPVRKTMLAGPAAATASPAPVAPKPKPKTMLNVQPGVVAPAPAAAKAKPKTMIGVPPAAKTGQGPATVTAPAADKPAPRFKYTCPGCKAVISSPTALPPGKVIKCPRCVRTFAAPRRPVGEPQGRVATVRHSPPTLIAPAAPKPAVAPRPATAPKPAEPVRLACPGCKAVLKLAGMPAPGTAVKCPKCARPLRFGAKPASTPGANARPMPNGTKPAPVPANEPGLSVRPQRRLGLPVLIGLCGLALLCAVGYSYLAGWWGSDIPASDWAEFAPPGGRCHVLMPGKPVASDPVMLGEGTVSAEKFTVERKGTAAFTLTWSDRRAEVSGKLTFNDIYGEITRYLLDNTSGWIQEETDIIVNGQPGKEIQILPSDGGLLIARVFLVRGTPHDRVYVLLVAGPRVSPRGGDGAKFLESFKIETAPQPARRERGRIRVA